MDEELASMCVHYLVFPEEQDDIILVRLNSQGYKMKHEDVEKLIDCLAQTRREDDC